MKKSARSGQERFFQCWRELSDALHTRQVEAVAYELMNEPVADNPEDWNKLFAKAVTVIRAKEPKRMIVIGSNTSIGGYKGPVKYPGKTVEDGDLAGVPEPLASEVRHRSSTWGRAKIAEKMAKPIALSSGVCACSST
jgi:endoglucanase